MHKKRGQKKKGNANRFYVLKRQNVDSDAQFKLERENNEQMQKDEQLHKKKIKRESHNVQNVQ